MFTVSLPSRLSELNPPPQSSSEFSSREKRSQSSCGSSSNSGQRERNIDISSSYPVTTVSCADIGIITYFTGILEQLNIVTLGILTLYLLYYPKTARSHKKICLYLEAKKFFWGT
ncbi:mCG147447 [Mus musculus]|nr:mCG147447 [Mus musculus]